MPTFAERIRAIAEREPLRQQFPAQVLNEVRAWEAQPEIDSPALDDLSTLPFVTIDGPDTRDLDQALHLRREGKGYRLRYAIADASHYVAAGSALFAEALERGASFYLPGFNVPMLPRPLSEGLVSLGPGAARRALLFDVSLDARGGVGDWRLRRARVRSQAKLAFSEVLELWQQPSGGRLGGESFAESLRLLREVGELRAAHEDRKQMVRYRRVENDPYLAADGQLRLRGETRDAVELANEQVSILCNALGAQYLATSDPEHVQPVYRVHAPPAPDRLAAFERLVRMVARDRGLPDDPWVYRRAAAAGLAGYLEALPTSGPEGRLARALHRQAMMVNGRSVFSVQPSEHFGVGETIYSRFTAPMREIVGVFCHKEAIERLGGGRERSRAEDETLRAQVVEAGNRAKDVQRRLDRELAGLVLEALLGPELARPLGDRPVRVGTVMGISSSKVHVLLDEPSIDVKLMLRDLGQELGGAWLDIEADGARLVVRGSGEVICRLGEEIRVRALGPDGTMQLVREGSAGAARAKPARR